MTKKTVSKTVAETVSFEIVVARLASGQISINEAYDLCRENSLKINGSDVGFENLIPHLPKEDAKELGFKASALVKQGKVNPMLFQNVIAACDKASKHNGFDKAAVILALTTKTDSQAAVDLAKTELKTAKATLVTSTAALLPLTGFLASYAENLTVPGSDGSPVAIGLRITDDGSVIGELPDSHKTGTSVDWLVAQWYKKGFNAKVTKDDDGKVLTVDRVKATLTVRIDRMESSEKMTLKIGQLPEWYEGGLVSGESVKDTSMNKILLDVSGAESISAPRAFRYCKDKDGSPMN